MRRAKAIVLGGILASLVMAAVIPTNCSAQVRPPVPPAPSPPAAAPPPAPATVLPQSPDRQRFQPETPGWLIQQDRDRVDRYKMVPPPGETTKGIEETTPAGKEPGGEKAK